MWIIGIIFGIALIIGIAIHRLFLTLFAFVIVYDAYIWWTYQNRCHQREPNKCMIEEVEE